ncbi:MAG: hypothetical protein J2P43_09135 [Candidatus Dormibacteraeota bacterium]|nr:hypothetical protein [Candidatus Dormibacteraeota bacterium]MBO0745168.1 hypothetical protein [Candidatus Dormibacteraeota bacterium]
MPWQRSNRADLRGYQRLAEYGSPQRIEADLAELDEVRQRLAAIGRPRPYPGREPEWEPTPVTGLQPRNVSEALALYDRGLLDDAELESLLGRGASGAVAGDADRRWWRRGSHSQPAYLVHRLGWGVVWRFAALAGLQLLNLPTRWLIPFVAALVVLLIAGYPLRLWRRRSLLGTAWRLALAEALSLATVRLPPIFYFAGLGLGAAILMADLIWTVLWPWMYEPRPGGEEGWPG